MIKIEKVEGGYLARTTPPDGQEFWRNASPLSSSELIDELRSRGMHTTDITDALYEADPEWLQGTKP